MGVIRCHHVLETYLVTRLGFDWDEVHIEAEELEYAVSERLLERLGAVLGYSTRDSYGDLTPTADDRLIVPDLVGPETLPVGSDGAIRRIQDDTETLHRLERAGIGPDSRMRVRDWSTVAPAVGDGGRKQAIVAILLDSDTLCDTALAGVSEAVIPNGSLWLLD